MSSRTPPRTGTPSLSSCATTPTPPPPHASGADTSAVRGRLPGPDEWTFPRDLLERGLRTPTSSGPVSIWPCGRVQAVMEFHSAQGVAVMQFDTKALIRFLRPDVHGCAGRALTTGVGG